jgi:RNA polymerase sigma-70 factor, ECF subfamily
MAERDPLIAELHEGRRRFLERVAEIRPELHRYCARMTGSIADGEDVVQETLARAYYALPEHDPPPPLKPWLFRIAHHRAIDHLRRYERRMGQPLDVIMVTAADEGPDPEEALSRGEAVRTAISRFIELAPAQRSAVILKDVLGHSLEEIAWLLELTVPAVKAALHRGRERLRALAAEPAAEPARRTSPAVARYAALFNARDWDGFRAMLSDDVRLELLSKARRDGRGEVGDYVTNYDKLTDWRLVPAWLDGREVLAVYRDPDDARPGYFVELSFIDGRITLIRDFRYVPYIADDAEFDFPDRP